MAVLKCKMCGGSLDVTEGMTVCECEYCGTMQTIPSVDDEKKITLFTRANRLRASCEFDKASGVYENIVSNFPEEAEAYWGLVLCKFGIEYVDDPATGKKIPTCHRSSFESIMDDPDFEQTMENADAVARKVYREEAKYIDGVQKGILEISGREEPYDIFICYKETDDDGNRTVDSVMAQDIYDMLTENKYRVFFARISLEDKLGTAYEPYIFAALNSARIMLAVGTDYEYYNAVWVKNEWSRFIAMMSKDKKKVLIPCYKDIDAYDIPKEFKHLQAQDMGKVGAMQDLLRGIKKILPKETAPVVQQITRVVQGGANVNSLLQRAFIFLEDGDWQSADEYCEKVLDIDPKNGEAYLGKLMAELKVRKREDLSTQKEMFDDKDKYKKIMHYGTEALQKEITDYNSAIICRNAAKKLESAKTVFDYVKVKQILTEISSFKEAEPLIAKCDEIISADEKQKEETYQKAFAMASSGDYLNAIITYSSISNYKDTYEQINMCAKSYRIQKKQQQGNIGTLRKQHKDVKDKFADLDDKLASLKKQEQHLISSRDSLKKYKEEQNALIQQKDALSEELSGLGAFAFLRKKQIQSSINNCNARLVQLSNSITALDNGKDYDTEIQPIQAEIEGTKKKCADLQKKIDDLQNEINTLNGRLEILSLDIIENMKSDLTKEDLLNLSQKLNKYIQSNRVFIVIIPDGVMRIEKDAFKGCSRLFTVVIPKSVTSIGEGAFRECSSLTSAVIPDSVTKIENGAFYGCTNLASVYIPHGVTSIGEGAFYECESLTSVIIPESVTNIEIEAFYYCSKLSSIVIYDSVTSVGERAFSGCMGLADENGIVIIRNVLYGYFGNDSKVTIPDGTTTIGENAFYSCLGLIAVFLPDSVEIICQNAFVECKNLVTAKMGSGVKSIGTNAFCGCEKLQNISFPSGLTYIGECAFKDCHSITSAVLPNGLKTLNKFAFRNCSHMSNAVIPGSVLTIGVGAFEECEGLTSLSISRGIEKIDIAAFSECKSLKVITIPDSVKIICGGAFENCKSLTSVTIPGSVEEIGCSAFKGCRSLKNLKIQSGVRIIGGEAFMNCISLTDVNIPYSVQKIGWYAFQDCENLRNVKCPPDVVEKKFCSFLGHKILYVNKIDKCNNYSPTTIAAGERFFLIYS